MNNSISESVFDIASQKEFRRDAVRRLSERHPDSPKYKSQMADYILSDECVEDLARLKSGEFYFDMPTARVYTINKKNRLIYTFPQKQMQICSLINQAILLKYDNLFSDSIYSSRPGRYPGSMFITLRKHPELADMYCLKADIKNYGPSIKYSLLAPMTEAFFMGEPELINFLKLIASECDYIKDGTLCKNASSVKAGLPFCSLLESIFLTDFDTFVESRSDFYLRYCDDILIYSKDRKQLESLLKELTQLLEKKGLEFHPDKTGIHDRNEEFIFMGMRICGNDIDFERALIRDILKKIKATSRSLSIQQRKKNMLPEIALFLTINKVNHIIEKYGLKKDFKYITTDKSLKVLDKALTDLIRSAASGTTGREKYKITYRDLNKWGYKSLVNQYYQAIKGHTSL